LSWRGPLRRPDHEQGFRLAHGFAGSVGGFGLESDETHAAAADIGRDVSLGDDRLARLRVACPPEFLLGMKQPGEIHGSVGIAEELRSRNA